MSFTLLELHFLGRTIRRTKFGGPMSFTLLELHFLGKTIQWRKLDTNVWKVLPNVKETLKLWKRKTKFPKLSFKTLDVQSLWIINL